MTNYKRLTKEEIYKAFENTNFGTSDYMSLVYEGLMKAACGYHSGYTMKTRLMSLNLITDANNLTPKGKRFLYDLYETQQSELLLKEIT